VFFKCVSTDTAGEWGPSSRHNSSADSGSNRPEVDLICPVSESGGSGAAARSSSGSDFGCHCDNAVLRIGGPRTSVSGGGYGLPADSRLVSAWLGIDAASSMRVLCVWTFVLSSSSLLWSSGSLSVPASGDLSCTPDPSSAISASRLVVVSWVAPFAVAAFRRVVMPGE